jgi:hypothetical protein
MSRPRLVSLVLLLAAVAVFALAGVRQLRLAASQAPVGDTATSRATASEQCGLGVPPDLAERCRAALAATYRVERQQVLLYAGLGALLLLGAAVIGLRRPQSRAST